MTPYKLKNLKEHPRSLSFNPTPHLWIFFFAGDRDARYLHPNQHDDSKTLDAIDRLTQAFFDGLGQDMVKKVS